MLKRVKTWRILKWNDRPAVTESIELACPHCWTDAVVPIGPLPGGMIIAAIGLTLVFDPPGYRPPENFLPDELQCRACNKIFSDEKQKGG